MFLKWSDHGRYGDLLNATNEGSNLGRDECPDNTASAFEFSVKTSKQAMHDSNPRRIPLRRGGGPPRNRVQLLQQQEQNRQNNECGTLVPGVSGQSLARVACHHCHKPGHCANDCPNRQPGVSHSMVGAQLSQKCDADTISSAWVLLDAHSTESVISNASMVDNARNCDEDNKLVLSTSGGPVAFDQMVDLRLFNVKLHFNKETMATVLSLSDVEERDESDDENADIENEPKNLAADDDEDHEIDEEAHDEEDESDDDHGDEDIESDENDDENEKEDRNSTEDEHDDNTDNNEGRPKRDDAGTGADRLEMAFDGKCHMSDRQKQCLKNATEMKKAASNDNLKAKFLRKSVSATLAQSANLEKQDGSRRQQMPASKGFALLGEEALAAMMKERAQLSNRALPGNSETAPVDPKTLVKQEMERCLEATNLAKEKRHGKIKGRARANKSKQRRHLKEDESASSPTEAAESTLVLLTIDAMEDRDVAAFDIPGAFLRPEAPENKMMLMMLRGRFAGIMRKVNPKHEPNVMCDNKGRKTLRAHCMKFVCGCTEAAILWCELCSNVLNKLGFKINPCGKCAPNATMNGKQRPLVWHSDDNKLSHAESKAADDVIKKIEKDFGKLMIARGNDHAFLGMKFRTKDKKLEVDMKEQSQETTAAFGEELEKGSVSLPAGKGLMMACKGEDDLDEDKCEIFHSAAAKSLCMMKRARLNLDAAVSF